MFLRPWTHGFEKIVHVRREHAQPHQVGRAAGAAGRSGGSTASAVERHRRQRGVDAAAVGQAGVDHRRRFVDPPAHAGGDPLDDAHQMVGVAEPHVGLLQPAEALDVHLVGPLTRMSVTAGSAISGASGPTPSVSSSRSSTSRRRSASLSGRSSACSASSTNVSHEPRERLLAGRQQVAAVELVEQPLVQLALDRQIFGAADWRSGGGRPAPSRAVRRAAAASSAGRTRPRARRCSP